MPDEKPYRFGSFTLDPKSWKLLKNDELRPLRPKTFAILRYLLDNAGHLATKKDLFAIVWPGIKVENSALRVCMNELRQALDDDAHCPRFVETVHRLGYRFIAPVAIGQNDGHAGRSVAAAPIVVGRDAEFAVLTERWEQALGGTRQIVFVVGEPGIGKTTLMDRFLSSPQVFGFAFRGHGQCADQYGEGEAYCPIFEAIDEICRGPQGKDASDTFMREAPNWAGHVPRLASARAPGALNGLTGSTSSQMLGEISAALKALAAIRPVVIVLEDLHLGDRGTLELIRYLARRRDPIRLMVAATHRSTLPRPDRAWLGGIVRDLRTNPQCRTLRLSGLKHKEVAEYLDRRLKRPTPEQLVNHVHRRAGGNPLFMTAIVDHLESQHRSIRSWPADLGVLGVPDNIHAMIEQQIEELPESDQKILKLASVAGSHGFEFSSAALAAALEDQPEAVTQDDIEEQCERLTRRVNFLRAADVTRWSDGTTAASYTFGHALYQEVLYAMLSAGQRARAHLRIAQRLEKAYGAQAGRMAAELAMHFERGGDYRRAAEHLNGAADGAINRGAALEALRHTEKALQLLRRAPEENDRSRAELRLEATRQVALVFTGAPAIEIQASVERMDELAREIGIWAVQLLVVQGITKLNLSPTESRAAVFMIKAGLRQAEKRSKGAVDSELVPLQSIAHMALAIACNRNGEFRNAVVHAQKAVETYDSAYQPPSIDSRIVSIAEDANARWFLGFPNKARENARQAIAAAEKISHAPALVYALARGATVFGMCRETEKALAIAERLVAFAADKDLPTMRWWGQFLRGAFRTAAGSVYEGCRLMRSALAELDSPTERFRAGSTAHARAVLCFAEVEDGLLRPHEAFARLTSIVEECMQTGSEGMLSDIYRMIGLIKMAEEKINPRAPLEAESFFLKAIETAHAQSGKSLELRATLELARLWRRQDKGAHARKILTSIYRRFSEGHDTPDLEDAKALIAELG